MRPRRSERRRSAGRRTASGGRRSALDRARPGARGQSGGRGTARGGYRYVGRRRGGDRERSGVGGAHRGLRPGRLRQPGGRSRHRPCRLAGAACRRGGGHRHHHAPPGRHPRRGRDRPVYPPCCYPFGADELDRLAARLGEPVRAVDRNGAPALDLPAGVRVALHSSGAVLVGDAATCTSCSDDHWSWRQSAAPFRQATVVWRP